MSIALAAGLTAGCSSSSKSSSSASTTAPAGGTATSTTPSTGGAPTGAPIKIGVVSTMSGTLGYLGGQVQYGAQAAADYINAHGGVLGRPLQLIVKDDAGTPTQGLAVTRELLGQGVTAILGSAISSVLEAQMTAINPAKIPVLSSAQTPSIYDPSTDPTAFLAGDTTEGYSRDALTYLVKQQSAPKIGILDEDIAYTNSLTQEAQQLAASVGATIVSTQKVSATTTDVSSQIRSLKAAGAQALLIEAYSPIQVAAIHAEQLISWDPPVASPGVAIPPVPATLEKAGIKHWYGMISKNFVVQNASDPVPAPAAQFIQYFKPIYTAGDYTSTLAVSPFFYDAMTELAAAIKQAGSTDGPAIVKALESGTTFPGVWKDYTYSSSNHVGLDTSGKNLTMMQGGVPCPTVCLAAPGASS